jgi:hypothetical protein
MNNFKASKMLGNCKPPILLDVEFGLWKAIVKVATGEAGALAAITAFLKDDVPWAQLRDLSDEVKHFYRPGKSMINKSPNYHLIRFIRWF